MRIDFKVWKKIFVSISFICCCYACNNQQQQHSTVTVSAPKGKSSIYQYASAKDSKDSVRLQIPNYPLRSEKDLDILMEQIGDARVVLLGEATHGTSEFYTWRAAITKRLIHPIKIKQKNEPPDLYPSGS